MPNDFISREAAINAVGDKSLHERALVRIALEILPAADIAPVVHGHWIPVDCPFYGDCSKCGETGNVHDEYCRHCGAKMDGGEPHAD